MSYAFASMGSGGGSSDPMDMSDAELDALIASRFDEDAFFSLDNAIAFQPPSFPQWFVDGAAGLGDALSFGLTRHARGALNIDAGIDTQGGAYVWGERAALVGGGARLAYAGGSMAFRAGGRMIGGADGAYFAWRGRDALKITARGGLFPNWRRPSYQTVLQQKGSYGGVISAAGRTNPHVNVVGISAGGGAASNRIQRCMSVPGC